MPHNQTSRIVFGADGKPNDRARRMFNIAPNDIAHLAAAGLQAGEVAPIWYRVGSGNPLTSGGSGANEDGVDFVWAPLTFAGVACALTPESNTMVLGLPGTYCVGDPDVDPTFAGDVNIAHHKLDFKYHDFAAQFKSAMAVAAASGDGVIASGTYDPATGNLTLMNTNGGMVVVNVPGVPDTLTALTLVAPTTLEYVDENGVTASIDLASAIAAAETVTTLSLAGTDLTYVDEDGVTTTLDLGALLDDTNLPRIIGVAYDDNTNTLTLTRDDATTLTAVIPTPEDVLTSLTANANILTYTDEAGDATNIDLSLYLDDTNLARLVSGSLDGTTGIATFTRDDNTTFDLDLSALLDDTNLARVVSGAFNGAGDTITLTRDDGSSFDIAVPGGLTETVTTLALNAGALDYTDEAGVVNNIPLVSAEAGNLLVTGDDGALYALPLVSEACYRELVDAPEPGTEFTLDNTTGGPSNAGVTFGTSQMFHAPDRQIFFDTNVLPFGARIKSVSMFEERRGNNTAPVRTQYGGVNSSAVNVAAHGNGYSATRSTSTFATSQLVDAATPLILVDPSQNHWDYAQGAGADFIASITPGTATASGGANDGATSSLTGFNALVEFELSQINEYTVREYSDGETTKLVYFDTAGAPVEIAAIPAAWEVCPVDNTPLVSSEAGNTLLLGDDGALYAMPLVGETCYQEISPLLLDQDAFADEINSAQLATLPAGAHMRWTATDDTTLDTLEVNGFNGTVTISWTTSEGDNGSAAVTFGANPQGIALGGIALPAGGTIDFTLDSISAGQMQLTTPATSLANGWTALQDYSAFANTSHWATRLLGTAVLAEHTVREYSDGETTKLIEFVAGEPTELANIPAGWTVCPEVDTEALEQRVTDLEAVTGDGVVETATLSGTNELVLSRSAGADVTVDLSPLAGGGGGSIVDTSFVGPTEGTANQVQNFGGFNQDWDNVNFSIDAGAPGVQGPRFDLNQTQAQLRRVDTAGGTDSRVSITQNSAQIVYVTGGQAAGLTANSDGVSLSFGSGAGSGFELNINGNPGATGQQLTSQGPGTPPIWGAASDERIKDNIVDVVGAGDAIDTLRPVTFTYKGDGVISAGFIAQEVESVLPDLVAQQDTGEIADFRTLDYNGILAITVQALKETRAQLGKAEARIATLEDKA